jgi:3-methyladenine DNA glycosylase AlkD
MAKKSKATDASAMASKFAAELEKALRAVATPERAIQEKKYLKSDRVHLGATVPQVRREVHSRLKATHWESPRAELLELCRQLWARDIYELRSSAVEALGAMHSFLEADDLPLLQQMIREAGTWALVDPLSTDVAGRLVDRLGIQAELDSWITDKDFWVRRAAMLAWLRPLRAGGPLTTFFKYADRVLDEKEFFIRKAIGWVLRDVSRKRPEPVGKWVEAHVARMNGVTLREAVKKLDPKTRERILEAYAARKPATKEAPQNKVSVSPKSTI